MVEDTKKYKLQKKHKKVSNFNPLYNNNPRVIPLKLKKITYLKISKLSLFCIMQKLSYMNYQNLTRIKFFLLQLLFEIFRAT